MRPSKLNDDGFYTLMIGAADMGTGCDTTLAQIAAEVLDCDLDNITVFGADTDTSPYDSGLLRVLYHLRYRQGHRKVRHEAARPDLQAGRRAAECTEDEVEFDGKRCFQEQRSQQKKVSERDRVCFSVRPYGSLEATETHTSPLSPPPFMVGAAEVEVDTETGEVKLLDLMPVWDCGTPINPNLTRVQTEGGLLQGIGMTLTENITYDKNGYPEEKFSVPVQNSGPHRCGQDQG